MRNLCVRNRFYVFMFLFEENLMQISPSVQQSIYCTFYLSIYLSFWALALNPIDTGHMAKNYSGKISADWKRE